MKSAIYRGTLHHRRLSPKVHDFKYNVLMFYLDLSEVDGLFNIPFLLSNRFPRLLGFKRSDYLAGSESLIDSVRDFIFKKTGKQSRGPIRLLTQIRYLGFCFNPVSFYYCFDEADSHLEFVVSEITNTPWNERKSYVVECIPNGHSHQSVFQKDFHVSPFFPMSLEYFWSFNNPNPTDQDSELNVYMEDRDWVSKEKVFFANLNLYPMPMTRTGLAVSVLSYPLLTVKAFAAIYWQAFLLKVKGIPFYSHPKTGEKP